MWWNKPSLIKACEAGNLELVQKLIEKGADVNSTGETSLANVRTPLGAAVESEHIDIVEYLLSVEGIDPTKRGETGGWTPLMLAARNKGTGCMKLLLKRKDGGKSAKTINMTDKQGRTALDIANTFNRNGEKSKKAIIQLLVRYGAKSASAIIVKSDKKIKF